MSDDIIIARVRAGDVRRAIVRHTVTGDRVAVLRFGDLELRLVITERSGEGEAVEAVARRSATPTP